MKELDFGYKGIQNECEYVSNDYLKINNCGMIINKKKIFADRPARSDYMIIYLFKGKGYWDVNGTRQTIQSGDLFLIEPDTWQSFGFDNNSQHYWIHFTGSICEKTLNDCGIIPNGICKIGISEKIAELFHEIYFQLTAVTANSHLLCNGLFLEMCAHIGNIITPTDTNNINVDTKILPALKHIAIHYNENHPLSYYAELCNISISRFKHLFVEITEMTPQAYITSVKISNAQNQLLYTNTPISEIASNLGYDDPFYFSRVFKKVLGVSPANFRKQSFKK